MPPENQGQQQQQNNSGGQQQQQIYLPQGMPQEFAGATERETLDRLWTGFTALKASATGQPYRPDGAPEHLFGKNDKETIDKLYAAYNGARKSMGEKGAVPEKPDAYTFEPNDKLKPFVANFDKDPVFAKTRELFHKAGITDKQFQALVPAWMEMLIDGGLVATPVDAKKQLLSLAPPEAANLDDAGKEAAASRRIANNIAWVDGAKAQKTLPEPVAEFFAAALASDPRAHHAVEWLRGSAREPRPAMDGTAAGGTTDEQIKARLNDPRNNPSSPQFDRAFAAETDRLSKAQWH